MTKEKDFPLLKVSNLHKSFGDLEVLKGIDLEVNAGDVLTIVGGSGSGKSTFLRCIHQLEEYEKGKVVLDGEQFGYQGEGPNRQRLPQKKIAKQRARIGMVFQHFALFKHMTVLENVIEGPIRVLRKTKEEAIEEAMDILDSIDLADKQDSYPKFLSGGQQQRVGIARALALKPRLMLFDEPTSALDPELIKGILNLMTKIAKEGMTMIVVTHEISFADNVSSHLVFFHNGKIWEKGTVGEMLNNPKHLETQQFFDAILVRKNIV